MKHGIIKAGAIFVALLLLVSCTREQDTAPSPEPPAETAEADGIEFKTPDIYGYMVDNEVFSGHKLTLLYVWGTYGDTCGEDLRLLAQLGGELADNGVQVMSLVTDVVQPDATYSEDHIALAQEIAEDSGADFTHLLPNESLNPILEQVFAVPTTFFFDAAGNQLGEPSSGSQSLEDLRTTVQDKLSNH